MHAQENSIRSKRGTQESRSLQEGFMLGLLHRHKLIKVVRKKRRKIVNFQIETVVNVFRSTESPDDSYK